MAPISSPVVSDKIWEVDKNMQTAEKSDWRKITVADV